MSFAAARSMMSARPGPGAEVIGEHHDVEAVAVDGRVGDLFEVGCVRRDAEEADLALLLQSIEGLVDVRIEESVDGVAGVDVNEVDPIGLEPFAGFPRRPPCTFRDRGARREDALSGRQNLVATNIWSRLALHGLAEAVAPSPLLRSLARCRSTLIPRSIASRATASVWRPPVPEPDPREMSETMAFVRPMSSVAGHALTPAHSSR